MTGTGRRRKAVALMIAVRNANDAATEKLEADRGRILARGDLIRCGVRPRGCFPSPHLGPAHKPRVPGEFVRFSGACLANLVVRRWPKGWACLPQPG